MISSPTFKSKLKFIQLVRDIQDFPKPGIVFKDLTPVYRRTDILRELLTEHVEFLRFQGFNPTKVVGLESRGFITGILLADILGVPFVPIRKKGKLPPPKKSQTYNLEYGTDTIEAPMGVFHDDDQVVIHDDILATGGTANAAKELLQSLGVTSIAFSFLGEIEELQGWKKLGEHPFVSSVKW